MSSTTASWYRPQTEAVRRALQVAHDPASVRDLLFLEAWEAQSMCDIGSTLRASQIRRANPELAEAIRAELDSRLVSAGEHNKQHA